MTIERKVGMGIAGQPSGGATDVADVFSTYLWAGNGGSQVINNGIDLAGEGGMVWIKKRTGSDNHSIYDTERGGAFRIQTQSNTAQANQGSFGINAFNSNGFSAFSSGHNDNASGQDYASWTFRKKKKFFDVVTYSGNGVAGREIAHGLNGPVGMMVIKKTSSQDNWPVYHIANTAAPETEVLFLNATDATWDVNQWWNDTAPTDTVFTLGSHTSVNLSGETYVAYLWADNSAEDAEDQMIKCGSYTGNGSATGPVVNLGWEPQFVLIKNASDGGNWLIMDSMRGIPTGDESSVLAPNSNAAESSLANLWGINLTATGFQINVTQSQINASGQTYIYMAIRAPMMIEPEAATDVFAVKSYTGIGGTRTLDAAFGPVDMAIAKRLADSSAAINLTTRSTSKEFSTNVSDPEGSFNFVNFESNSLVVPGSYFSNSSGIPYGLWAWKRAKGFFDVVAYAGTDTYRWQSHSLGAVPEMIWVKGRTADVSWAVYHKDVGASKYLMLNDDAGQISSSSRWGSSDPTDSLFRLGSSSMVNAASDTYVAYLFTTLDGISKCGSYVGNGTNQTIDCGFSAGARLILIKPSSTSGAWYLWDSARGIVAGGDPHLMLHSTAGQITGDDSVDPHNSGFKVNQIANTGINVSSTTYIFYAIA